jgi:beta-mannanase
MENEMTAAARTLAGLVLALGLGATTQSAQAQSFYLGASPAENTSQFELEIGHSIAIDDGFQSFDAGIKVGVYNDIKEGIIPMVSWSSTTSKGNSVLATDILAGKYDQQLRSQAVSYALLATTVMLEWQPEMTDNKRNAQFFTGVAPAQWGPTYVAVWQYIHALFLGEGATNVQWVWSPGDNAYEVHDRHGQIACQPYFPGVDYVDWMGFHSYNQSQTPEDYGTDPRLLAFYDEATAWAPGKPLIHAQTAAVASSDAQVEWIQTAQSSLKANFPLIRGFIWFNSNTKQYAYALAGSGITAFAAMAADPYFQR